MSRVPFAKPSILKMVVVKFPFILPINPLTFLLRISKLLLLLTKLAGRELEEEMTRLNLMI